MSHIHGWKSMSTWRKHQAEKYRTGRGLIKAGESFVHVEGLGTMCEAKSEEEKVEESNVNKSMNDGRGGGE